MRRAFVALVPTAVHGRRNGAEAKEVRWAAGAAAAGLWRGSDASPGKSKRKNERRGGVLCQTLRTGIQYIKNGGTTRLRNVFALLHQSGS